MKRGSERWERRSRDEPCRNIRRISEEIGLKTGKVFWTCDQDGCGQNNQKSIGDNGEDGVVEHRKDSIEIGIEKEEKGIGKISTY